MGDNSEPHKVLLMRYEMQLFLSGPESRCTSGPLAQGASLTNLVTCRPVARCSWRSPEAGFYSGRSGGVADIRSTRSFADEKPSATPAVSNETPRPLRETPSVN